MRFIAGLQTALG